MSDLSLAPTTFLPLASGATVRSAATKRGSRLSFRVSETARVRTQIHARKSGRRVGRRCLPATRARRKRRKCTRYVSKGSHSMPGQLNGLVRRTFTGRIRGRGLPAGPYRLSVTATDLAGNRSKAVRKGFRMAKPPRKRARRR